MEGKNCTDGTRCLCRLESNGEFLLVSKIATIPPDNNFHIRELPSTEMASSGTISRACSKAHNVFIQGWKQFPCDDDPDHSEDANTVLQSVVPEIQKCRRSQQPPVIHLDLCKYRYAPGDERYHSYYFLYVHAGKPNDNFFLYITAGLLNDQVILLRLSSRDNTCDP